MPERRGFATSPDRPLDPGDRGRPALWGGHPVVGRLDHGAIGLQIHDKGMLILSGYLGGAVDRVLVLLMDTSASMTEGLSCSRRANSLRIS